MLAMLGFSSGSGYALHSGKWYSQLWVDEQQSCDTWHVEPDLLNFLINEQSCENGTDITMQIDEKRFQMQIDEKRFQIKNLALSVFFQQGCPGIRWVSVIATKNKWQLPNHVIRNLLLIED